MRLFVGIALAPETRQALEHFVSHLRNESPDLRWSPPGQWHVTLQFLGDAQEEALSCIVRQLHAVTAKPVMIALEEPGFFMRAKVFHIQVRLTDALLALHHEIGKALRPCGFEPEDRAYSPHITLARNRGGSLSPEFKKLQQKMENCPPAKLPSFTATEFLLYQSFLEAAGSRYEVRERFRLM